MMNLYRLSFSRIWPIVNESNRKFGLKQLAVLRSSQSTQVCNYCKRFGLYDEEDDTQDVYNRRGAYVEQRIGESGWPQRRGGQTHDEYDDDDVAEPQSRNRYSRPFSNRRENYSSNNSESYRSNHSLNNSNYYRGNNSSGSGEFYRGNNSSGSGEFYQGRRDRYPPNRMGSGQFSQYERPAFQPSFNGDFGQGLKDAHFDPVDFAPIEKDFYSEHPNVASRSEEDVNEYRKSLDISIKGTNIPKPIMTFEELNVSEPLMQVITEENFEKPTAIQSQGWPVALSGRDMIGISQTGSGKTLVFALPAMIHVSNQPPSTRSQTHGAVCSPKALVLAPTRELAQQIHSVCSRFRPSVGISSSCVYGGAARGPQLQKMRGSDMCIATPGRLIDFIVEGSVSLQDCTYLVLDEADRMLDMGFEPQIRKIIGQIRPSRQTLMWSATWPKEVQVLAEDFLQNYVQVTIGSEQLSANPNIEQNIYIVSPFDKFQKFCALIKTISEQNGKVLVFSQTKKQVDFLANKLERQGLFVMAIHGDVSQSRRDRVLSTFRNQKSCILIATDVAARGLDITDVQHVINYDFPPNIEDYIHRIGRTARGSNTGSAHSFFTEENGGLARELIAVLQEAGQTVNPQLLNFVGRGGYRPKRNLYGRENRYERNFA